jgi:8-oxo-dGTP diphosphatase
MSKIKEDSFILESLINIFTVEKGILKILLERKKEDPYKGYWILPNETLKKETTLEINIESILNKTINTSKIYIEQNYTFSGLDRNPNNRIIGTSYIGLVDNKKVMLNAELELKWFNLEELPKIGYDHKEIIEKAKEQLKTKLVNTTILKNLFPNEFTLPELQSVFESIMNKKLDRRNFRKKFLTLNLIEETGNNSVGGSGRPAKLYSFKEKIKELNLF